MNRRPKRFINTTLIVAAAFGLALGSYVYFQLGTGEPPVKNTELNTEFQNSAKDTRQVAKLPVNGQPALSVSEGTLEQSDTFIVSVANTWSTLALTNLNIIWNDRRYDLFPVGNKLIAILGADAKKAPGSYPVVVSVGGTQLTEKITVTKRAFPVTELALTPELEEAGYTPPAIRSGVASENDRLNAALIYTPAPYFQKQFINPLENIKISGAYGNIRKSGLVELQHLGVDLEAPEGTPVYAINDGLVRLAEEFTNYGKTIVIDHGVGIFSFYLHLSEFVAVGERVARGEIIGRVGNTGYSLEPHLHFSVRIRNASVDPLRFIEKANPALLEGRD